MAKVTITAPNSQFNGKRAGIGFVDGKAEVDVDAKDAAARTTLDWFSRHGYKVSGAPKTMNLADAPDVSGEETVDAANGEG